MLQTCLRGNRTGQCRCCACMFRNTSAYSIPIRRRSGFAASRMEKGDTAPCACNCSCCGIVFILGWMMVAAFASSLLPRSCPSSWPINAIHRLLLHLLLPSTSSSSASRASVTAAAYWLARESALRAASPLAGQEALHNFIGSSPIHASQSPAARQSRQVSVCPSRPACLHRFFSCPSTCLS